VMACWRGTCAMQANYRDETSSMIVQSAVPVWCCCCACSSAAAPKRDELKSTCYSINDSAVRGGCAGTKCEGKYWVLPRTAQNVRESIEYFLEQLCWQGKSMLVPTNLL
jgi:hypothetical protein